MTDKMKCFADAYVGKAMFNGQLAAEMAGYKKKTARVKASTLLARDDVQAYLAARRRQLTEQAEIDQSYVVRRLKRIADGNLLDYISWDETGAVTLTPSGEMAVQEGYALTKFRTKKIKKKLPQIPGVPEETVGALQEAMADDNEFAIELADKVKALTTLGKYLGMFERKEPLPVQVDGLAAILERIDGGTKGRPGEDEE